MWVKICGITRLEDAVAAARFGADAVGFVFAESPRGIAPDAARDIVRRMPDWPAKVGVFVDSPLEEVRETVRYCGLDLVQLQGSEDPEYCEALGSAAIKAVRVVGNGDLLAAGRYQCEKLLLDTHNGARPSGNGNGNGGGAFDWSAVRLLGGRQRVIVAGGLHPDNVAAVVKAAHPYGVDVAGGVESEPGVKDHVRVYRFIEQARKADYEVNGC